jgi:hypothetical protein
VLLHPAVVGGRSDGHLSGELGQWKGYESGAI